MNKQKLDECLQLATESAIKTGRFLSNYSRYNIPIHIQNSREIKIPADLEAEAIILNLFRGKTDFAILSEEQGFKEGAIPDNKLRWIIDPLDGSFNFYRGIPNCCVSIGLYDGNSPILGVIYDFNRHELFTGIARVGAWLNGNQIKVSKTNDTQKAILFTGFPVNTDFSNNALRGYISQAQNFMKIRMIGSAALSLAYVAAGKGDVYLERGIMMWDVAAGLAILSGAGGKYVMNKTHKRNMRDVYATNKLLIKGKDSNETT